MQRRTHKATGWERRFIRSWWVVGWCLICFAAFEQGKFTTEEREYSHIATIHNLRSEIERLDRVKEELMLDLASLDDPVWIEQSLINSLGVCPDGEQKVYFPIKERVQQ